MFDPNEVEHIYVFSEGELRPALLMSRLYKWREDRDKKGIYRGGITALWITGYNTVTFTMMLPHVSEVPQQKIAVRYWMRYAEARRFFSQHPLFNRQPHQFTAEEKEG